MATMDPGQRGFGRQRQFNIPDLPFRDQMRPRPRPSGGMRPQGQIPPQLLQMLMARLMVGQGGGRGGPQRMARGARGRQRPDGWRQATSDKDRRPCTGYQRTGRWPATAPAGQHGRTPSTQVTNGCQLCDDGTG